VMITVVVVQDLLLIVLVVKMELIYLKTNVLPNAQMDNMKINHLTNAKNVINLVKPVTVQKMMNVLLVHIKNS